MDNTKKTLMEPYSAPDLEVYGVKVQQVLCQSGSTQQYNGGNTDDWYDNN